MVLVGTIFAETQVLFAYPDLPFEECCEKEPEWDVFADILLLKAAEVATWALKIDYIPFENSAGESAVDYTETVKMVTFNWHLGARAGLGYHIDRDYWDTQIYYTWFHTHGSDGTIPTNALSDITTAFLGEWLSFGFVTTSGNIQWTVHVNALDWDLGRTCDAGRGLTFRPVFGIKGGWINQTIHSQWTSKQYIATEDIKNNFWGVGPKGGIDTNWSIGSICNHSFNIFGDTSLAFLGGRWFIKDVQKSPTMNSQINGINPTKTWTATFMFQGQMGLSWDMIFNKDRSNVGVRVGYEFQYWFDQLKVFTFLEGTLHSPLILQGGMLDVHFNF